MKLVNGHNQVQVHGASSSRPECRWTYREKYIMYLKLSNTLSLYLSSLLGLVWILVKWLRIWACDRQQASYLTSLYTNISLVFFLRVKWDIHTYTPLAQCLAYSIGWVNISTSSSSLSSSLLLLLLLFQYTPVLEKHTEGYVAPNVLPLMSSHCHLCHHYLAKLETSAVL